MANGRDIAKRIEQIKSNVVSFVNQNMVGSSTGAARFRTAGGLKVGFELEIDPLVFMRSMFINIDGFVSGKHFEFHLKSSMMDYGTGTIVGENYGIMFWNVGDSTMDPIIKLFEIVKGKHVLTSSSQALVELLPVIDQVLKDTGALVQVEMVDSEVQETSIETRKKDLEKLRDTLVEMGSTSKDNLVEGQSHGKQK